MPEQGTCQIRSTEMSSLYLHIPFCSRKCPYCDFFSQVGSPQQLDEYVNLLCQHLEFLFKSNSKIPPLMTLFFGGGTPSLLTADQVGLILNLIRRRIGICADAEISLEANPGTLDPDKLGGYRLAGVNRLSLGVQSLRDDQLRLLGRIHTAEQALAAISQARAVGFDNLNLDLMFNLPGQNCRGLIEELEQLLALQPEHLSLYGLSFEEGTEFAQRLQAGKLKSLDEEEAAAQYRLLHERMQGAGFEHYEISNFARPGFRCRHNQIYWQRRGCLAAGCGAHSFMAADFGSRWAVPADLESFRRRLCQGEDPADRLETFDRRGAMAETIYLALRTADGLSRLDFHGRFGEFPESAFPKAFRRLGDRLSLEKDHWRFDLTGWLLFNHLISQFL